MVTLFVTRTSWHDAFRHAFFLGEFEGLVRGGPSELTLFVTFWPLGR
jgi:hypothetical protein